MFTYLLAEYDVMVGTGASCVYPLLGARLNGWQFAATDADATNVDYASANVAKNQLTDKITGKYRLACTKVEHACFT